MPDMPVPLEFTNSHCAELVELFYWLVQQNPCPHKGGKSVHFSKAPLQNILDPAPYGDYYPEWCSSGGSSGGVKSLITCNVVHLMALIKSWGQHVC